jgi:hypothetical protein
VYVATGDAPIRAAARVIGLKVATYTSLLQRHLASAFSDTNTINQHRFSGDDDDLPDHLARRHVGQCLRRLGEAVLA